MPRFRRLSVVLCASLAFLGATAQNPSFKVIAFYTAKNDAAHISYVHEANRWFAEMAKLHHFSYDSTNDWSRMTETFLSGYQVVLFLDTRPEDPAQRLAFQHYMEHGGGWMGFHFAAFALTPSDVPANWDWYHKQFLGSGSYVSNVWRPSAAILNVEGRDFPALKEMPAKFASAPNEWYRWSEDLRKNPDIKILVSIDSASYPLGSGPKPYEIWHSGYYPVVWTNTKYRMIYMNIGHNDIDYDHRTNQELSFTLRNPTEERLILDCLLWLGGKH